MQGMIILGYVAAAANLAGYYESKHRAWLFFGVAQLFLATLLLTLCRQSGAL